MESISKFFDSVTKTLKQINSAQRLWAAFIIMVTAVVLALIFSKKIEMQNWYIYLFFGIMVVIAIGLVLDLFIPKDSKNFKKLLQVEEKIKGTWGELMLDHDYIALSIVVVKFNRDLLQFILEGKAFNKAGEKVADWKSEASAISSYSPIEMHYFWEGRNLKPKLRNTSGIGVIDFFLADEKNSCTEASGWYTSENTFNKQKISGKKYQVSFKRMSAKEAKILQTNDENRKAFIENLISDL